MPVLKSKMSKLFRSMQSSDFVQCTISPKTKAYSVSEHKNRYRSASLTTEAALVFPVFFFGIYMLWQLFLLLLFQMAVCSEITGAAMTYAHLGYPERKAEEQEVDISWLYQPLLWEVLPESDRVEKQWVLCLPEEDGSIRVRVSYRFVCEAVFFSRWSIPVQQNFRFYPYLGENDADLFVTEGEEQEDIVYMTEHGTVYHESRACVYLNVAVRSVAASRVGQERNSFGAKYTLCERCDSREKTETVYVSAGGTKYHLAANCPSLKRTVIEKSREDVADVPACHKCGKTKEGS